MFGGLGFGTTAEGPAVRGSAVEAVARLGDDGLTVRASWIRSTAPADLRLEALTVDGQSVLADVADPAGPEMAATSEPGRVQGQGRVVSALTGPLEIGALYLVSYEIIADGGTSALYFSNGGGCPFPNTVDAPFSIGRHRILVEAVDGDTAALLRVTGDLTFRNLSCVKAEWRYALPTGPAYPDLALRREPGRVAGANQRVTWLESPVEVGRPYTLTYSIRAADPGSRLFTPDEAGAPFAPTELPATVGHHAITLVATEASLSAVARVAGNITFGHFSCRAAGGIGGRQIVSQVAVGSASSRSVIYTPDPGALHVAPWGDDTAGSGAFASPFRTPGQALARAVPGDTIYLRPGIYAPFAVTRSGTADLPITITTLPGEERRAIVEGDLDQHVVYGGAGVVQDLATRDGIYVRAQSHVHIRNLVIRKVWRSGIFVIGAQGESHTDIVIAGNEIARTGSSGIGVFGQNAGSIVPLAEINDRRIGNVLIEFNDVSQTNVETDYNGTVTNSQGEPGGVTEAISVAALVEDVVTRFNDVHDTRQYGIDYKAGVRGGAIHDNRVWNVERYGIYLDAGRRHVEDVAIYNNRVWNCRMGIVLSREAGSNTIDYDTFKAQEGAAEFIQTLRNIDVYNNLIWDIEKAGLYCQRHGQKDGPDGEISTVRLRFNSVANCNRDGTARDLNLSGWSDADFEAAGVVSGVEFIGNIVWNATAPVAVLNTFEGAPGFRVAGNLIGTDPGFADPAATPPDLSLVPGTAAAGLVDAADTEAPFAYDIDGADRRVGRAAGAYAAG